MSIRLDRFIGNTTALSRSGARQAIRRGRVEVDGTVVRQADMQVGPGETAVCLDGAPVVYRQHVYLMLHKPLGTVCSADDPTHPTVGSWLPEEHQQRGLHAVGRLDQDATGLVLLTDDGEWSHRFTSPRRKVEKHYRVETASDIREDTIGAFQQGVVLRDNSRLTRPAKLVIQDQRQAELVIVEGRYHQVKRMFAAVGNLVSALHRMSIGNIHLDPDLAPGEWRELTEEEIRLGSEMLPTKEEATPPRPKSGPATRDRCVELLCASVRFAGQGRAVVLLEEDASVEAYRALLAHDDCVFLASRWEVYEAFAAAAPQVRFCDADLSEFADGSAGSAYLRVVKEKPLVHHVVNGALRILRVGGTLHLAGMRREGIQTYVDKAAGLLGGEKKVKTTNVGARCAVIAKQPRANADLLPDQDYRRIRQVALGNGLSCYSKPGVFGWRQEDPGSALLMAHAPIPPGCSLLDLGCGYGYLAIKAREAGAGEVWATDNSAAAIAACQRNFEASGIPGEVLPAFCGDRISRRFEVILCNPPFHQGFSVKSELGGEFLAAMARLLEASGRAYVVVNSFIPLEKHVAAFFADAAVIIDTGKFKVFCLAGPT